MLKIKHHILYKKDFKKLIKNGFDDSVLNAVILTLRKKEPLDPQFQDHALKGSGNLLGNATSKLIFCWCI
ncbi:hypothetical protein HPAKL117_04280 [Helicobacter pylori Aklavik117]|nr:hypothetical protein HPAKL117_04280 [Helicobacter pylori Aklavik117]